MSPKYTDSQAAAIAELKDPLQLIACAGSGKTQVISQRIAEILKQPGIEPRNIIAFTFTEKAAAELEERISTIVETEIGDVVGMADMYVGTMHAFCLNLLQTYVPEAFKFGVLTEITQRLLIDRLSKQSGLTTCPTMSPNTPTLRRYIHSGLYAQVLSILQEDDVDWDQVAEGVNESLHSYLRLLSDKRYFDYTTMVATAVDALESDELDEDPAFAAVVRHIREDIRYVVVDEYQDVNPLQERLIAALVRFGANLCVVGDDDQTIYQWRGSEVSNILTFANRFPGTKTINLADNFRSTKGIVEFGRSVAELIDPGERLHKRMEFASHQEWVRGDMLALEFGDDTAEASWIADRIEAIRGVPFVDNPGADTRGLSWSDCSVLFRSVRDADALVAEFRRRDIPYIIKGLARLFDSPEIVAVVGLFRYMVGEVDGRDLEQLWADAHLIPDGATFARAMSVLDAGSTFGANERWGVYNIQRLYLNVLESIGLTESSVPGPASRGELVFYQLGKFSQVISDFENIYFSSSPDEKYRSFAGFLEHQAPGYYEESDQDVGYATPDAVTITTVHRSKGMQWPAVFLPCVRRNRFPSSVGGGLNVFHVVPVEAIENGARYRGGLADETRLFYVAVTRAQKYLYASFSPGSSTRYTKRSQFFDHCTRSSWFSTSDEGLGSSSLPPTPKHETPQVTLSFSELKYVFDCPYQFKLRFMYGFNPPLHEALGYGKGVHDALAELHKRALDGELLDSSSAEELVDRHLHTPFAYPTLYAQLRGAAIKSVNRYFQQHGADLPRTIFSEKDIRVQVAPGVTVNGRIDLVKRLETDEVSIVDFKSTERAQAEDVTRDQLHVYALGYRDLTGDSADLIEVLNLDEKGKNTRERVRVDLLEDIGAKIAGVAEKIRANEFECSHRHGDATTFDDLDWLCRGAPADVATPN